MTLVREKRMQYYSEMINQLRQKLNPRTEIRSAGAAVALLLRLADQDFKILLVKRVDKPSDPWSGQIAFPGGKRDTKDQSLVQTVIRETLEETGIDLGHGYDFLGTLKKTQSTVKPELYVAPFVFLLDHDPAINLNEELEGFLWVPLRTLWENKGTASLPFGEVPAYLVKGRVVWGLTYRILEQFARVLRQIT